MKRGSHRILTGSCLDVLPTLPANHFHCCATSPPYFGLRSYLPDGHPDKDKEIGSEVSPDAFLATMVAVFREVRRVLRDDGILWVNLGDSYSAGTTAPRKPGNGDVGYWTNESISQRIDGGVPAGNQMLMPHRVALALQADGWILRQTVCWQKRSPMPESVNGVRWSRCRRKVSGHQRDVGWSNSTEGRPQSDSRHTGPYEGAKWEPCPGCEKCEKHGGYVLRRGQGRCTTAFEYVFLFAKSSRYFWDMENCREEAVGGTPGNKAHKGATAYLNGDEHHRTKLGLANVGAKSHRIPRNVWTLSSEPTKFKHFATFPSELVRRMLLPLSPKGCCPVCGQQWAPVVDTERVATRPGNDSKVGTERTAGGYVVKDSMEVGNRDPWRHIASNTVTGYRPTCECDPMRDGKCEALNGGYRPVPCEVLDPFSGIGTTGQTACFLGHNYTGIELNPEYAAFSETWINQEPRWSLRLRRKATSKAQPVSERQLSLFGDEPDLDTAPPTS